jgi:CheY-like chemotaxis protein
MSDEFQKSMFEPFTQDENNPERLKLAGGTGLGLSIVKKLVTLMGGTIMVDSEMGHGSHMTVHCVFPMYRESAAQSALKSVNTQVQTPMHGTVLLAEDNQINAEIAARLLESIGLQSKRAVNGDEAWKMFDAAAPGTYLCVLMDIRMPVMNGYESAKKIRSLTREDAKKIPIIALTADAIKEDTNKAYDSGMNAYLTKPIDLQKLQNTIRELVFPRRN